jgi:hypothetical protein
MSDFNDVLAAEGLTSDAIQNAAGLTKLTGDASKLLQGQFVLDGQPLGTKDGFKNVSAIWLPKTLTFEQGFAKLAADKAATEDILCVVSEMKPTVDGNGAFAFQYKDGRFFRPTEHAMGQIGNWADTGTWFVENMLVNPVAPNGKEKYVRDAADAETLARVIANGFRRLDKDKKFLFRTRVDGTMRAMLTERFAIIDNGWFLEVLKELIPGGRLSHWRGDGDTLFGNVLIPDTIREEKDSEYGGMLSIGNSEIGERRISTLPSIFRAICMNGCIWGATKGKGIGRVHRGTIKLADVKTEIRDNLMIQIPLLPQGIDRLLSTQTLGWKDMSERPVIAQVAKQLKLQKGEANAMLAAFKVEAKQTPELANTLFTVINSLTRAGQDKDYNNQTWLKFDEAGGELSMWTKDDFETVVKRAKTLKSEEVDLVFGTKA